MKENKKRLRFTVGFNAREEVELELYMKTFHIEDRAKAVKSAISFANKYLKNVTDLFFPLDYDVFLCKKRKNQQLDRRVF